MNERRMHVLIDLVGYTGGGERANEIFASRPAALQVTKLLAFHDSLTSRVWF